MCAPIILDKYTGGFLTLTFSVLDYNGSVSNKVKVKNCLKVICKKFFIKLFNILSQEHFDAIKVSFLLTVCFQSGSSICFTENINVILV